VVAALLIALLTLSVALSIHQVNLHRQQLRYEPVEELVLGITSDLDRCLTRALSIASQEYYATGSEENATRKGYDFISKWVRSILASYSHLGIKMTINQTEEGLTFNWNNVLGFSQVYAKFDLDVDAYGFKGWVGESRKFVTLKIFPDSILLGTQNTTLKFQIMQGKNQDIPIPNLTPESLKIWADLTGQYPAGEDWIPATVTALNYLGGGKYTVTFNARINERTQGVKLLVITPEDNIYVSARSSKAYSYGDIFLTLQSQEEYSPIPTNLGLIRLGDTIYILPNYTRIDPGIYILRYFPEEGDSFLNWTTIGAVTVGNPRSSITSITIDGNGTITAFYRRYTPPEPIIVNLTLDSRDWTNSSFHLGSITFGTATYNNLPANVNPTVGDYPLQYIPEMGYVFQRWELSGDVIPASTVDNPTTLRVIGNGTVIAIYALKPPIPILANVTLQSMDENPSAPPNLGKIRFGETLFGLPNSTTVLNGTYLLEYVPEEGYTFINWITTENIIVQNLNLRLTSVTVKGNGIITAFYRRSIPLNLVLDSREWNYSSTSLGNIILGLTNYDLPNTTVILAGDYPLQYIPENMSYVFLWWEFSGDVIPASTVDNPTTLRVIGNGTVIAVYRSEPAITTPVSVTLQSLEETLAPPGNLGKIQLGGTLFELPNLTTVFNGTYLLSYIPAEGYTFLNWTTTAGISVKDPYSPTTSVTINNNGTITAFYRGCNVFLDSRHLENLSFSLGSITLGTNTYSLPKRLTSLAAGNYAIQYTPLNSSYIFLRWEVSGDLIPANSTSSTTELRILGDGMLIAVYYVKPPAPTQATVTLRSVEETSASQNLGKIQFGETLFGLPNSTTVLTGSYLLEYIPAEGFSFLKWTTTGNIVVENQYSSLTIVTVNGNGTITAIYRGCKVFLDSIAWDSSSQSLGKITLGSNIYTLPKNVTGLPAGDYLLQYSPHNDSYVFLWWEFSGDIVPWNSTSSNTTLTVYGDGAVTAVYGLISEPPPPFVGDWSTLYVDTGYRLMPPFMWSGKSSHLPSRYSTGTGKQWADLISPPTPTLYLARYVNVTAYVRPNPPWNAKDVTLELGFAYNGQYYFLGSGTYPINSQGVYTLEIDILYGQFPGEIGVIPEGSEIILTVTVTFFKEPWGTFFLYYGPKNPSRVELF